MRIHTDNITWRDLMDAARKAGREVRATASEHGSRSRVLAWEVSLTGTSGRRPNTGRYGSPVGEDDGTRAATWDEWGMLLAHLFEVDPDATAGPYDGVSDFDYKTGGRYDALTPEDQHRNHRWNFLAAGAQACDCGAVRRFS